jgi:hypothetical protein
LENGEPAANRIFWRVGETAKKIAPPPRHGWPGGGRRCSGATVPLPEVDVREDTNAIVVEVELPGVEAALGEVVVLALLLLLVLLLALDGHHAIGERH